MNKLEWFLLIVFLAAVGALILAAQGDEHPDCEGRRCTTTEPASRDEPISGVRLTE